MRNRVLKLLFLTFFLAYYSNGFSQDILWEKSYGGKHADYLMDAQPTPDYGFILAGSSLSNKTGNKTDHNKGDLDYCIWKMNEDGDLDWQKSFGGTGNDLLQSIALTNDGGFILGGISSSDKGLDKKEDCFGGNDYWVIKLNAAGVEEWQITIGGESQEKLHSIKQTRDGGFILGGSSSSEKYTALTDLTNLGDNKKTAEDFGSFDYWVVKLDTKGKIQWQKTFGGKYVDELRSIDTTVDGGFILGGYSNSPASGNKTNDNKGGDYWIIKLDLKGEIQWQRTIGGNQDDQLYVIHQTYDKGYILGGNSNSEISESKTKSNTEGTDFWVVKLNEEGELLWQETYNYGNYDVLTSIVENADHTILIGGFAKGEISGNNKLKNRKAKKGTDDYIALKINDKGEELWSETVGSDGEDILKKVVETRDGGYLFTGTSNPQSFPSRPLQQNSGGPLQGISYTNEKNQTVQNTKKSINDEIDNASNEVNQSIKDNAKLATEKISETAGLDKDSPLKLGVNDSNPLNLSKIGDGKNNSNPLSGLNSGSVLPPSGDKKKSFGNYDFWIVKLKDKNKPKEEKASIEAYPNPSKEYTNVIVGYDFETGTATLVDLAGHVLQSFEINSRTVPVDLSGYPEGIYIVNISTNVQSNGVKVIKIGNKK